MSMGEAGVDVRFSKKFWKQKGWEWGKYPGQNLVIWTLNTNKCSANRVGQSYIHTFAHFCSFQKSDCAIALFVALFKRSIVQSLFWKEPQKRATAQLLFWKERMSKNVQKSANFIIVHFCNPTFSKCAIAQPWVGQGWAIPLTEGRKVLGRAICGPRGPTQALQRLSFYAEAQERDCWTVPYC